MAIGTISNSAADLYAAEAARSADTSRTNETTDGKKVYTNGRTVGNPKLSDKAAKYYEELKKKYGDMDFVLVSKDKMEEVKANAAAYGSANKTVVLIDEEKIERMANDEEYRKKYEGIIESGKNQLKSLAEQMGSPSVKGFGMQVNNDGTVSFFAAMEKSSTAMNEKLAEKRAAKKAAEKSAEKKAHKKEAAEKLKEKRAEDKEQAEKLFDPDEVETISASSIEELIKKIEDFDFAKKSDTVLTEQETYVGGNIDFKG